MNTREEIHDKIDELLGQLSTHNNRLSLHDDKISHLDVDVLRKQCIDLYEQLNRLALEGKLNQKPPTKVQVKEVVEKEIEQRLETPEIESEVIDVQPVPKKDPVVAVTEQKKKPKEKTEDEMISLFERYNSKPIDEISKAISISKRFEFQNNFFEGDANEYKEFIENLDKAGDRESAFDIYHKYKKKFDWDNEDLKDELKSLLYRKYHT